MRVSCVYALAREYVSVYAHTCQCVGRGVCQCVLYDVCLVCVYSVSVRRVPVCVCQCVSMCVSVCVVVCVWEGRGVWPLLAPPFCAHRLYPRLLYWLIHICFPFTVTYFGAFDPYSAFCVLFISLTLLRL